MFKTKTSSRRHSLMVFKLLIALVNEIVEISFLSYSFRQHFKLYQVTVHFFLKFLIPNSIPYKHTLENVCMCNVRTLAKHNMYVYMYT